MIDENDYRFLTSRKRFLALWNYVAVMLFVTLGSVLLWMYLQSPWLADPVYIAQALQENRIDLSVIQMSALILPIVIWFLFAVVAIFIGYGFMIISNEKRYLAIIEKLLNKSLLTRREDKK